MNVAEEFRRTLVDAGNRLGAEFGDGLAEIEPFVQQQLELLSRTVDEPGYETALVSARNSVALRLGIQAVDAGDAVDREIIGLITGALAIGARAVL